jgi:hypothetical protein
LVLLKKWKTIFEKKCPFNNGTLQQHTDNHFLLRLMVWKGQNPLITIPEEFCFTITTVLAEEFEYYSASKQIPCSVMEPQGYCWIAGFGGGSRKGAIKYFLTNNKGNTNITLLHI